MYFNEGVFSMGDKIKVCAVRNDDSCVYSYFVDYAPKCVNYDVLEIELPTDFQYYGKNFKEEQLIVLNDNFGDLFICRIAELLLVSKSNDILIANPMICNYEPKKCKYKKLNDEMCYDAEFF